MSRINSLRTQTPSQQKESKRSCSQNPSPCSSHGFRYQERNSSQSITFNPLVISSAVLQTDRSSLCGPYHHVAVCIQNGIDAHAWILFKCRGTRKQYKQHHIINRLCSRRIPRTGIIILPIFVSCLIVPGFLDEYMWSASFFRPSEGNQKRNQSDVYGRSIRIHSSGSARLVD